MNMCDGYNNCGCNKCTVTQEERVISRTPKRYKRSIGITPLKLAEMYGGKVCYDCEGDEPISASPDKFLPTNVFRCKSVGGSFNGEVEELYVKITNSEVFQLWVTVDSGYEGIFDADCDSDGASISEVSISVSCDLI